MPQRTLPESLEHLCVSEHLADVTFIFSDGDHATVHAHRLILAMRSDVFDAMFYGPMKETESPIKIEDIDSDTFKKLLGYVYTDRVDLDEETITRLLYAARKYCLDGLFCHCSDFLERSMTIENVCAIYEQAKFYDLKELVETCFTYIITNANAIMQTSIFTGLSHETMCIVLSCENLRTTEIENFNALLAWAIAKCAEVHVGDVSPAAARHEMGDALYHVRLPLVPIDVFTEVVVESGILTMEETIELYKYMATRPKCPEKEGVGRFSSKFRMGALCCVKLPYASIRQQPYKSNFVTVRIVTSLKLGVKSILFSDATKVVSVTCASSDNRTVDIITKSVFLDDDDKRRLVFNPPLSLLPKHVSSNTIRIKLELDRKYMINKSTTFDCYGSKGVVETSSIVMAVCFCNM